jgi:hypothetical protein
MAQQTSEKLRFPLMILAALSIAGFVWWLSVFTEPTQFAVAQEEAVEDAGAAPTLELSTFEQRADDMAGSRLRLQGVEVATSIGPRAFLTSLPEGKPYVIRLMPAAGDLNLMGGEIVDVTGTVRAMSNEVLDAWEAEGVITDPTAREIASFGITFIEAEAVTRRPATDDTPPAGDDDDL